MRGRPGLHCCPVVLAVARREKRRDVSGGRWRETRARDSRETPPAASTALVFRFCSWLALHGSFSLSFSLFLSLEKALLSPSRDFRARLSLLARRPVTFFVDSRYRRPYLQWKRSRRVRAPGFFFLSFFRIDLFTASRVLFSSFFFYYFLLNVFVRVIGSSP